MRHGIAELPRGKNDKERSLTSEGISIITQLGVSLLAQKIQPKLIISSTYLRAIQTSDILASALGYKNILSRDARLTPISTFTLLQEIIFENENVDSLLIVSHEPAVSEFTSMLCNNNESIQDFSPASICCIKIKTKPIISGKLQWFKTADELILS